MSRDDFSAAVLRQVASRAGFRCSLCRGVTVGPSDESASKASSIGVGCHITAAAPGGARYDPTLSPDERSAIENAIWMCNNHSRWIDSDEVRYTVSKLHEMKARHEASIRAEIEGLETGPQRDVASWVSDALLSWPATLPDGTWLARDELEQLREGLDTTEPRAFVLLGAPGAGKSSLLARLAGALRTADVDVVAIKADRIPKNVSSQEALAEWTGASEPIDRILRHRALTRRTVLVVDQLDALADLVDIDTARLDVILELLDRVRAIPNLHLVVSCRSFEFRHDLRLRRLDAEPIELALPSWDRVEPVLKARGLDASGWPDRLRQLLLVPQQLKVFLEVAAASAPTYASYQAMLERLWTTRVKGDAQRVDVVNRIASHMAAEEVLEAPLAIVDDLPPRALEELVAGGILRCDALTVTFVHQSLFDFARARTFAAGNVSLVEYVVARQSGLFVRPLLWSSLTYLRGARLDQYKRSFTELWERSDTRLHVRVLLAEFLGQLEDPDPEEVSWLEARLDDVAVRRPALAAMQGSPAWFGCLGAILPKALDAPWKFELTGLLCGAAGFAPSRVVDLLETHWSGGADEREASVRVLRFLGAWDQRAVGVVARMLVSNDALDTEGIVAAVAEVAPELAPRVIASVIGHALGRVEAGVRRNPPTSDFEVERRYEGALSCCEGLVDLRALALHAPRAYLEAVFPVFQRAAALLAAPANGMSYRHADIGFGDDAAARFAEAVRAASEQLARDAPDAFLVFAGTAASSDLMAVHRVLAAGYSALPLSHQSAARSYVAAEERRLRIGTGTEPDETSVALLRVLSASLSSEDARLLEARILQSSLYEARPGTPPTTKRACLILNRAHRARLLRALPFAELSTESRMLIASVETKEDSPSTTRGYFSGAIGSPMSADQMARAHDSHLLGLFALLTDSTEWSHPRRDLEGGSIEASRSFGEFAKREPERVAALIEQFAPVTQERPVAHALTGLAEISWRAPEWERIVFACDARGFRGEEFRWHVASAVGRRAQNEEGASEAMCALLQRWIAESDGEDGSSDDVLPQRGAASTSDASTARRPQSLLFGFHGGGPLPRGNYPALHALFCALMFRSPPEIERFLAVVEGQLGRSEAPITWYWLCFDLRHLAFSPDRQRAEQFLRALFEQRPDVLETDAGALLIAHSIVWVSRHSLREWVEALRGASSTTGRQAAGELLVLASSLNVELDLTERLATGQASVDERIGIALATAHVWYEGPFRPRATEVLLRLYADVDVRVRESALSVLDQREELPLDDETRRLLDAVTADADLVARLPTALFQQVHLLLPSEAARVRLVMNRFLDAVDSGNRVEVSWLSVGPELMRAAVTLQRLSSFRDAGMAIFERLLAKGAYGIDEVLFDLDARPRRGRPYLSSPRRFPARRPRGRRR